MKALYPWQQPQWDTIKQLAAQQRLPHALLLSGQEQMGKLAFAHVVVNYLCCQQPQQMACGQCRHCQLLTAHNHPDVHILQPEKAGQAIKIDQIRALILQLNQTPQLNPYKFAIIEPAEAMNLAAANAILKTLEEPSGNTLIFLVSHELAKLLPTIRSRCQQIKFPIPSKAMSEAWLQQALSKNEDIPALLALADGVPLRAFTYAQTDMIQQRQALIVEIVSLLKQQSPPTVIAAKYHSELSLNQFSMWLMAIFLDILKLHQQAPASTLNHINHVPALKQLAVIIKPAVVLSVLDIIKEAQRLANRPINMNAQLLIERVLIELLNVVVYGKVKTSFN